MNPVTIAILTLRGFADLYSQAGEGIRAQSLNKIADLIEAGAVSHQEVEEHMAKVAAAMRSGEQNDWDDVVSRIETHSAQLG